jgi:hypothetical protein
MLLQIMLQARFLENSFIMRNLLYVKRAIRLHLQLFYIIALFLFEYGSFNERKSSGARRPLKFRQIQFLQHLEAFSSTIDEQQ